MFGFGSFSHILFLLILGLILIGPKQLPEVARTIGRLLTELRRASNMFTDQFNAQLRDLDHQNHIRPDQNEQKQNSQEAASTTNVSDQPYNHAHPPDSPAVNTDSSVQAQASNNPDDKKS